MTDPLLSVIYAARDAAIRAGRGMDWPIRIEASGEQGEHFFSLLEQAEKERYWKQKEYCMYHGKGGQWEDFMEREREREEHEQRMARLKARDVVIFGLPVMPGDEDGVTVVTEKRERFPVELPA